jgi:hypothetical protein
LHPDHRPPRQNQEERATRFKQWVRGVERLFPEQDVDHDNLSSSPTTPLSTNKDVQELAILVDGFYSSSSSLTLLPIYKQFRQRQIKAILFNYKDLEAETYGPADTCDGQKVLDLEKKLSLYFTHYHRAQVHLVGFSMGSLICAQFGYQNRGNSACISRVQSVFLLASPIRIRGATICDRARSQGANRPIWGVVDRFGVLMPDIRPTLDRTVTFHCDYDHDRVALYEHTCLLKEEQKRRLLADNMIESVHGFRAHFQVPEAAADLLGPYIDRLRVK